VILFDGHTSDKQGAEGMLDGVTVTENRLVSTIFNPILFMSLVTSGFPTHYISTYFIENFHHDNGLVRKGGIAKGLLSDVALDVHLNASTSKDANGFWICYDNLATEEAVEFCNQVIGLMSDRYFPTRRTYLLPESRDGFADVCGGECSGIVLELEFISNEPALHRLLSNRYAAMSNLASALSTAYRRVYLEVA